MVEGWFRCVYCGDVAAVPGAGVLVTEAPDRAVCEIARPGRRELVVRAGFAVPGLLLGATILLDLLGGGILRAVAGAGPIWTWAVGAVVYAGIFRALYALYRRQNGRQHLEVRDDGTIEYSRRLGNRKVGSATGELASLTLHELPEDAGSTACPRLSLRQDEREVACLWFENATDREWFRSRLIEAGGMTGVALERALQCDGCGGDLGRLEALRRRSSLDCPHCGAGLVYTNGGVQLPELRITPNEGTPPVSLDTERDEEGLTVRFPAPEWSSRDRCMAGATLVVGLVCLWPLSYVLPRLYYSPILMGALVLACLAPLLALLDVASSSLLHREVHVSSLAIEVRHRLLGRNRRCERFSLARLLEASVVQMHGRPELHLRCALRAETFRFPAGLRSSASIACVLTELRARTRQAEPLNRFAV